MKSKKISQTVHGVEYDSLSAIAEKYGIKYRTLYKRYARGARGDALVKVKSKQPKRPKHLIGGQEFSSATAACKEFGVRPVTFFDRRRRGLTVEQALGLEPFLDGRSKFGPIVQSVAGRSIRDSREELASEFGITAQVLKMRLESGWTYHQALELDAPPIRDPLIYKDIAYRSQADIARNYGIKPSVLAGRLSAGYTLDEALAMGVKAVNTGRYSEGYFNRYPEEAAQRATLYVARLFVDGADDLVKIGITQKTPANRLCQLPMQYEILQTYHSTLIESWRIEQMFIKKMAHLQFHFDGGGMHFDGRNEVFQLTEKQLSDLMMLLEAYFDYLDLED